jgi:hypothetical protein
VSADEIQEDEMVEALKFAHAAIVKFNVLFKKN